MKDILIDKWKPKKVKPEDDQNVLVCWLKEDGKYSDPHRAYYIEEEDHFFSPDSIHAFPLHVDIWIEMPEVPD